MLCRHVAIEVLVSNAVGQRQATERPLVLSVESEVPVLRFEPERGRPLRQADGYPIVERVLDVVAAVFRLDLQVAFLELETGLEIVTSGDVRSREALTEARYQLGRVVEWPE